MNLIAEMIEPYKGVIYDPCCGSGDFTCNAYFSIFTTPSTAKDGKISTIVLMVSHTDHSEHSVKVLITEQGVADLRGTSPRQRAELIIENCVAPEYKQILWDYLKLCGPGHTPINLTACFGMHVLLRKQAICLMPNGNILVASTNVCN